MNNKVSYGVIASLKSALSSALINTAPNLTEMKILPTSLDEVIDQVGH